MIHGDLSHLTASFDGIEPSIMARMNIVQPSYTYIYGISPVMFTGFQLVHWWFAGLEPYDFLMKGIVTMTMGYLMVFSRFQNTNPKHGSALGWVQPTQ